MIKCHLSRLMGEHKMRIVDVCEATGINRNMIRLLYRETATRIDLGELEKLCKLFKCSVGEMLEISSGTDKKSRVR